MVFIGSDLIAQMLQGLQEGRFCAVQAECDKFIPTRAVNQSGLHGVPQQIAAVLKHAVARLVPILIVDALQAGYIAIDHADRVHRQLAEQVGQCMAVVSAGQLIAVAQVAQMPQHIAAAQQRSGEIADDV